jgi:hypothetical protein
MSRVALLIAFVTLTGCAGTSGWRALSIDGTSAVSFSDSVMRLDQELSYTRRGMFRLALADIARTGVQNDGPASEGGYSDADFRGDLAGRTYEGVISLADRSGTPISRQYYSSSRWSRALAESNRAFAPTPPEPVFTGDNRFWPISNAGLIISDSWKGE